MYITKFTSFSSLPICIFFLPLFLSFIKSFITNGESLDEISLSGKLRSQTVRDLVAMHPTQAPYQSGVVWPLRLTFTEGQECSVYWTCAVLIWLLVGLMPSQSILCFGCEKDIISQTANRCNTLKPSYSETLQVWKRLVVERFEESNVDVDINQLLIKLYAYDIHDYPKKDAFWPDPLL